VPIERAREVAELAWRVATADKQARREHYQRRGLPLDLTVT